MEMHRPSAVSGPLLMSARSRSRKVSELSNANFNITGDALNAPVFVDDFNMPILYFKPNPGVIGLSTYTLSDNGRIHPH